MLDYIEIASALVITFSLLLLLFGVLWAPFAALINARVASAREMASGRMAEAGAKWSLPFFFPWIYLLLRILGKRVPDRVVVGAYILMYLTVLLGPILFNVLLAGVLYDIQRDFRQADGYATVSLSKGAGSFFEGLLFGWAGMFSSGAYLSFESMVFWVTALLASAAVFLVIWARSLNWLSASYFTAASDSGHAEPDDYEQFSEIYLTPLRTASRILRYWLLVFIAILFVGDVVFDDCIWWCTAD